MEDLCLAAVELLKLPRQETSVAGNGNGYPVQAESRLIAANSGKSRLAAPASSVKSAQLQKIRNNPKQFMVIQGKSH
jgi:hypothetical protein